VGNPEEMGQKMFTKQIFQRKNGFTLIELLIVIAIILILIAIALPNFLEAQIRAKVTQALGHERALATAMESYRLDFGNYPHDHDFDDYTENGLFQLTSPIQYISAIPIEPFAQAGGLIDPTQDEIGWEMASTGNRPLLAHAMPTEDNIKIHAFGIHSFGPDLDDNFPCGDYWPLCARVNPCQDPDGRGWLNYSPTNGSKSRGDIITVGGEWRSGGYCVNGWENIVGYWPPHIK